MEVVFTWIIGVPGSVNLMDMVILMRCQVRDGTKYGLVWYGGLGIEGITMLDGWGVSLLFALRFRIG